MTQTLRWGLLSTARINNALIPPLQLSKRNKLLAVASRSQEKADAYALEKKIKRAYGSYEALLADPEIDVIYNPLPNHLHAGWTIQAVEAGKHVLCEKPLALSLEEWMPSLPQPKRLAGSLPRLLPTAPTRICTRSKRLSDSGKLGKVKIVHGSFTFVMTSQDDIRWNPQMGGGSLWDIGCYPLSFTRRVLGTEPLEVFGWQVTSPSGVDEDVCWPIALPRGYLSSSWIAVSKSLPMNSWKSSATRAR